MPIASTTRIDAKLSGATLALEAMNPVVLDQVIDQCCCGLCRIAVAAVTGVQGVADRRDAAAVAVPTPTSPATVQSWTIE